MQRIEFRAMGCQMLAALDGESRQAAAMLAKAPAWFAAWEQALSRFREDSELSHLNRSGGRWLQVSPVLWQAVQAALRAARESDGLVTPTLLDALEAAGYDRTFEALGSTSAGARQSMDGGVTNDWCRVECDARALAIRLPPGMRLDLGGVAKGWAADRAARRLAACGPALVDAGGDIAVNGPQADGQPWPVGIAIPEWDPPVRAQSNAPLQIAHGGVATSGRDYRRWRLDGRWQHHILDPRTGRPALTDVISATVIAPSASEAEVAAKAALILGSREGLAWLEARPAYAGLLVLEDGRVLQSRRLSEYLWRL
jgi:thiamine biosynthesis lipoprotein